MSYRAYRPAHFCRDFCRDQLKWPKKHAPIAYLDERPIVYQVSKTKFKESGNELHIILHNGWKYGIQSLLVNLSTRYFPYIIFYR